jgi:hypothetical protein
MGDTQHWASTCFDDPKGRPTGSKNIATMMIEELTHRKRQADEDSQNSGSGSTSAQ